MLMNRGTEIPGGRPCDAQLAISTRSPYSSLLTPYSLLITPHFRAQSPPPRRPGRPPLVRHLSPRPVHLVSGGGPGADRPAHHRAHRATVPADAPQLHAARHPRLHPVRGWEVHLCRGAAGVLGARPDGVD